MNKKQARKQAVQESQAYRQGNQWVASTWDSGAEVWRETHEMSWPEARQRLTDFRCWRAAELCATKRTA